MGRLGIYNGRAESKQPRGAGEGSSCTYIVQAGCVLLHLASGVYGGGVLFSLGLSSFFVSPLPSLDTPFLPLFLHIFCSGRPNASYGDVKKKSAMPVLHWSLSSACILDRDCCDDIALHRTALLPTVVHTTTQLLCTLRRPGGPLISSRSFLSLFYAESH
jgi:hypothetical protein